MTTKMRSTREGKQTPKICITNVPLIIPFPSGIILTLNSAIPVGPPAPNFTINLTLDLNIQGLPPFTFLTVRWSPDMGQPDNSQQNGTTAQYQFNVPYYPLPIFVTILQGAVVLGTFYLTRPKQPSKGG